MFLCHQKIRMCGDDDECGVEFDLCDCECVLKKLNSQKQQKQRNKLIIAFMSQ